MKEKTFLFSLLLTLSIFLSGCPYESEFPLAMPETAQIDRDLIGNWQLSEFSQSVDPVNRWRYTYEE